MITKRITIFVFLIMLFVGAYGMDQEASSSRDSRVEHAHPAKKSDKTDKIALSFLLNQRQQVMPGSGSSSDPARAMVASGRFSEFKLDTFARRQEAQEAEVVEALPRILVPSPWIAGRFGESRLEPVWRDRCPILGCGATFNTVRGYVEHVSGRWHRDCAYCCRFHGCGKLLVHGEYLSHMRGHALAKGAGFMCCGRELGYYGFRYHVLLKHLQLTNILADEVLAKRTEERLSQSGAKD